MIRFADGPTRLYLTRTFANTPASEIDRRLIDRGLEDEIERLSELKTGWSFGEGLPITLESIRALRRLVKEAQGISLKCKVFANLDGGSALACYSGNHCLEFSIGPAGDAVRLREERGIGEAYDTLRDCDVSYCEAQAALHAFAPVIPWSSSESLISDISTQNAGAFAVWFAKTPPIGETEWTHQTAKEDFPSSTQSVPATRQPVPA